MLKDPRLIFGCGFQSILPMSWQSVQSILRMIQEGCDAEEQPTNRPWGDEGNCVDSGRITLHAAQPEYSVHSPRTDSDKNGTAADWQTALIQQRHPWYGGPKNPLPPGLMKDD